MTASGSDDRTIRLWDTRTGVCFCVIDGHVAAVNSVSFSTHGAQFLLSASEDYTVRRWATDPQIGSQIGNHRRGDHVALSSHETFFVSWGGGVAKVRNPGSRTVIAKFMAPGGPIEHCCFSPSGKSLAGVIQDIIFVWTIKGSPRLIRTDTYPITSLAFSSSLIVSSNDQSIKFWRFDALSTDSVTADPGSTQTASPPVESAQSIPPPIESARSTSPRIESRQLASLPIESISLQASDGIVITRNSAGVARIWDTSTGDLKKSFAIPAQELEWGDAELIGGTLTFGWFTGKKIHLWDTKRGQFRTVDVPQGYRAWDFRVSVKGSKVFLLDHDHIRAWSIDTGEVAGEAKLESEPLSNSLVVYGSRVWARFKDSPIQGWDFGSKASRPVLLSRLFSCPLSKPHLAFIDRTAVWDTDPSRIVNADTGGEVFRLSGRYGKPTVARWDGWHLVAGYGSGEVLILNWATMKIMICTAQPTK